MAKRRREPGRVKIKLSDPLRDQGFDVSEYDLIDAKGHWRSSPYADIYRWEAYSVKYEGRDVLLSSWDTMTACIRGINVYPDPDLWGHFDVCAESGLPSRLHT